MFGRIPIQEKILFARNLAVMTKAGMPLLDSLRLLAKQTKSKVMIKILKHLSDDIANGQFLSRSLEQYHDVFGDFGINIIRVGEASGILYENLNYLAEELKRRQALRRKVLSALIYPIIVVLTTIGVTGVLILYVFPKIMPLFKSLKVELPITTKMLIWLSNFFLAYGVHVAVGVIILIIIISFLMRVKLIHVLIQRFFLRLPLVGSITSNYNIANFCRTLGLLLKSDIKVVEAISITADTLTNLIYKSRLKAISQEIAGGGEISANLAKNPHLFPAMLSQLVAIGEATGNLSETLLYLSEFYEGRVDETTRNLSTTMEPFMMLILGAIVAFVAISIITPIYQLTQSL